MCSCLIEFIKQVGKREIKYEACRALYCSFERRLIKSYRGMNAKFYQNYFEIVFLHENAKILPYTYLYMRCYLRMS